MHDADDLPVDPDVGALTEARTVPRARPRRWDIVRRRRSRRGVAPARGEPVVPTPSDGFPWSTFAENVSGCLLLAVLMVYLVDVWRPRRYLRPFLGVGVLGGFTTFSTFTNEAKVLLQDGRGASVYVGGSVLAGSRPP